MRGRLIDLSLGLNKKHRVTVEIDLDQSGRKFIDEVDRLKDTELSIEIKRHRKRRSLNANAYFHLIVGKIAEELGHGYDETKRRLVCEYGTIARDEDGSTIGFKLPATVDVTKIYEYVKCFDTRTEDGKEFNCYLCYKHTSDMDTAEMARLIDGVIKDARELGIETDTPEQLARYKDEWGRSE